MRHTGGHLVVVVRDHHQRDPRSARARRRERLHQRTEPRAVVEIEALANLVHHEQFRPVRDGGGDDDELLLALREGVEPVRGIGRIA